MRRTAVLVLLTAVPAAFAAPKPGDPFRIAVGPAAAPKPSTQYALFPDRRDLAPGNAATLYYRAMASFVENSELLKEIRQPYWGDWLETPPKDLPMQEVGDKLQMARNLLHEVGLAARCKDCDWQIEDRPEGLGLLLPEVQGFRNVAVVLAVRPYGLRGSAQGEMGRGVPDVADWLRDRPTFGAGADAHPRPGRRRHHALHERPGGRDDPAARRPEPVLGADRPAAAVSGPRIGR